MSIIYPLKIKHGAGGVMGLGNENGKQGWNSIWDNLHSFYINATGKGMNPLFPTIKLAG